MPRNSTFLGTVQDVQGATISIALDRDTASGLAFIDGHGYRIGQIGSFIRIPIGFTALFGVVSHVGAGAVPDALADDEPYGHRWLRIQLVGESHGAKGFERGVSQYPTIGDEAHLVTEDDLRQVYGHAGSDSRVRIGSLASTESIPALIDANRLISRHSAVVGTTGAGKSTTVAGLLNSLSDPTNFPSSRVIVLDVHGEYGAALRDRASIFRINADEGAGEHKLHVPYWALSFDELLPLTPFRGIGDAEKAWLVDQITELKRESLESSPRLGISPESVTVDSPVPFSIHRLWYDLYRLVISTHTAPSSGQSQATEALATDAAGNRLVGDMMSVRAPTYEPINNSGPNRVYLSGAPLNLRRQVTAMQSLLRDTRYDFLFRPGPWCPEPTFEDTSAQPERDLDHLLEAWVGAKSPITILDLSGVPARILMNLVGALIRVLFDALFWGRYSKEGGRSRPLLFVLEEAHSYLSDEANNPASRSARRLVKEGRKYGLSAMVVSQRPAEIDPTILSQCGTLIAMRLANATDRGRVMASASDNLEGLFSMLPSLRTGEAIIVGEAVQLPLRALVDAPSAHKRPDSHDPVVFDPARATGWSRPFETSSYRGVLESWRSETPLKDKPDEPPAS